MRKISDAQILEGVSELRKMAVLKQALSKREKILMAILAMTGVTAGAGAAPAIGEQFEGMSPLNPMFPAYKKNKDFKL